MNSYCACMEMGSIVFQRLKRKTMLRMNQACFMRSCYYRMNEFGKVIVMSFTVSGFGQFGEIGQCLI